MSKKILSKNVTLCTSVFKKGIGLMFMPKMNDFAFVFPFSSPRKLSITMWFVFFPIDILFLDEHNVVVQTKERMKPFTVYTTTQKAQTFIELPAGSISKHSLVKGNRITWNKHSVYSD